MFACCANFALWFSQPLPVSPDCAVSFSHDDGAASQQQCSCRHPPRPGQRYPTALKHTKPRVAAAVPCAPPSPTHLPTTAVVKLTCRVAAASPSLSLVPPYVSLDRKVLWRCRNRAGCMPCCDRVGCMTRVRHYRIPLHPRTRPLTTRLLSHENTVAGLQSLLHRVWGSVPRPSSILSSWLPLVLSYLSCNR